MKLMILYIVGGLFFSWQWITKKLLRKLRALSRIFKASFFFFFGGGENNVQAFKKIFEKIKKQTLLSHYIFYSL